MGIQLLKIKLWLGGYQMLLAAAAILALMAWHALRLGGIEDSMPGWGRLFTHPLRG